MYEADEMKEFVYFELDTNTNSFIEIFNITPEREDSVQIVEVASDTILISSSDPMYYAINSIVIDHGIVEYRDNLTEERQNQLDLLLKLEQKKDGLDIELVYFNDVEKEKEVIAMEEVGKQFLAQSSIDYHEDKEKFEQYVMSRIESDSLDLNKACLTLADQATVDSLASMFTQARKANIDNYLQSMNDSTQITTRISNPNAPKNIGSFPVFEVKYAMKGEHTEQQNED